MWGLIGLGIVLLIVSWVLASGFIDFNGIDEKGLAGTLNWIGWALIIVGVILCVLILAGVIGGTLFLAGRN